MDLILAISILIRLVAMGWSVVLLRRMRDWRMGFLTVMLGLMAMRQTFTLPAENGPWSISIGRTSELPGLLVSIMAFLAVFFLERIVTERRRAEKASRDMQLMFQSLITHAPFSIWVCNGEGTIIFANRAALDLFGVTDPAQVIGRYNIYHQSTEAEKPLLAHFEQARAGEVVRYRQDLDMKTVKYDTTRRETLHFYTTLFAIPTAGGQSPNMVVIQEDITEKVRADDHIRHLQQVLKAIRDVNQLIVHEKDREKILQRACEILNQARDYELVWIGLVEEDKKDILPVAHAGFEEGYLESVRITRDDSDTGKGPTGTAIRTGKPYVMHHITSDPRYRPWREEAVKRGYASSAAIPLVHENRVFGALNVYGTSPHFFNQEETGLLVETGRDIAFALHTIELEEEYRRAQEARRRAYEEMETKVAERTRELTDANIRLKEIDRLKSEFLATMSHELRTPLNSIIGFTGIIMKGMAGEVNEEQKKQLAMVYSSAKHLLSLINGILDLSKIESGKMEISKDQFRVKDVVSEVTHSFSPMLSQKGLRLVTEIPDDVPEIRSDRKKFLQILLNLAGNAVKFTETGEIRIGCRFDEHRLDVSVSDTGVGIKEEDMELLFEAFRQIDGTAQRRYQGSGLGLYLCKRLVSLLGGTMRAESEYGKGSTFTFTLPLKTGEGEQHEKKGTGGRR